MKQITTKILCLLLALSMACSLFACGDTSAADKSGNTSFPTEESGSTVIHIDESGNASWESVQDAVQYEYAIVDSEFTSLGNQFTTETTIQLPQGRCVHLRPVFADGSTGDWIISDFYGTPSAWPDDAPASGTGSVSVISLDADGYAFWESVEGAVKYECAFSDVARINIGNPIFTRETSIRVPSGYQLNVRPIFADGSTGNWYSSDFYGEIPEAWDPADYVDTYFDLRWDQTKSWKLVENIDYSTVQQTADGGVTFSATAPNGTEMRFVGTGGVSVSEGAITFSTGGRLTALDAIGRICAYEPIISAFGEGRVNIVYRGGYTFNGETSVHSLDDLFQVWGSGITTADLKDGSFATSVMSTQPNMIGIGAGDLTKQDDFTISELIVYYDEATYATPIGELRLDYTQYGMYLEGDFYEAAKEIYDSAAKNYTFYLMVMPKLLNERKPLDDFLLHMEQYMPRAVIDLPMSRYTIGDLKDASGNVLDKSSAAVSLGSTLDVTICGTTYPLELPVIGRVNGVQTLHAISPYSNGFSEGDITTLVIPIRWSDYPDEANDELLALIREKLGRIVDDSGTVTDYSADPAEGYSLSAYYDLASYGAYHIESYMTDWVDAPYPFEQIRNDSPLDSSLPDALLDLVCAMYPDMDWSTFDRNSDGILDSVIFISASGAQNVHMSSFGGAAHHRRGYTSERAGTPANPRIKDFFSVGSDMLRSQNVVIHEYAHSFGIVDYYDVTYGGIDAVGGYDLQSQNLGDWNAFSKYAVGWIDPEVVTSLESGKSVDITIGAMAETGDAIVIPAADSEFDGPFGEYILVDLFADCGLNQYDAAPYGLNGVTGVRIYHVNAHMEHRTLTDIYGDEFEIGTVHYGNDCKDSGKYLIELLQNGGKNTFTKIGATNRSVTAKDFFYAGDSFDAANYGEFLIDGKMDDRKDFGYTIEVVSITGSGADAQAVIRVTRK